jgi:cytochrome c-type biogenesis protein CcmH/NrfG
VGGFLLYSKVLMPTPVELGTGGGVTIPVLQPIAASEAPEQQPGLVTFHAAPPPSAAVAVAAPTAAVPATPAASTPTAATAAPKATAARTTPRASQVASDEASPQDALVKQAFRSLNAGRFDNAIAQARRALDSAPGRADAWLVLGSAYDGLKDHHSAQLAFRACAARARGSFVSECKKLAR